MSYSHVLLDFDHTLLDTETSLRISFGEAMKAAGAEDSDRHYGLFSTINRELWAAVERSEATPHEVHTVRFERLITELDLEADPSTMADAFATGMGANGDLYPGTRKVLEELVSLASLALVTNGLSSIQRARIDRLEIRHHFEAIVISAEVGAAKPNREIFDIVFESLGWPPKARTMMVGDSLPSDIRGGADYGIATCWFNPHGQVAGPGDRMTYEICDLAHLPALVEGTEATR